MAVDRLATKLWACFSGDTQDVCAARQLVGGLSEAAKKRLQRRASDTLLHKGAAHGKVEFVRFLLDECGVDPNCDPDALLSATFIGDLDVVRVLVEHGVDVNRYWPSLIFDACYSKNAEVVRYLVDHGGADIHCPRPRSGRTCLMEAVLIDGVAEFLLERGADVHAVDADGNHAVYAVNAAFDNSLAVNSVQVLLAYGADPFLRNDNGEDAFLRLAIRGMDRTLNCLANTYQLTVNRKADLYAVTAARLCGMRQKDKAMGLWIQSVTVQNQQSDDVDGLMMAASPNPICADEVEIRNVTALRAIANDREAMLVQCQLVHDRILGHAHEETICALQDLCRKFCKNGHHQRRCVDGMKFTMTQLAAASVSTKPGCILGSLCKLIRTWQETTKSAGDVLQFFDVVEMLEQSVKLARSKAVSFSDLILAFFIDLIAVLIRLASSDEETKTAFQLTGLLVRMTGGSALLYFALNRRPSAHLVLVVEQLLAARARVNGVDVYTGNSALHVLLKNKPPTTEDSAVWSQLIGLLLRHGAHVDLRNNVGVVAADLLPTSIHTFDYTGLKCLAARAVRRHRIPYRGIVSDTLATFTDCH